MNAKAGADKARRKRFPWVLLALAAAVLAILISLGNWQVRRLAWKEGLLATIDARIHAEPLALPDVLERLEAGEDIEYIPVKLTGMYLPDREQHVLATWKGASGWHVYAPLRAGDGDILFVNRGFVPFDRKDPGSRPESIPRGEQAITGLARLPLSEKPGFLVPDNTPDKNQYYWKDLAAMTAAAGLESENVLPLFVDAGPGKDAQALPIGGVTNIDLPNNHLQYAVTWYGLALALTGVTAVFLWRRNRQP